jgi:hypothetical protein
LYILPLSGLTLRPSLPISSLSSTPTPQFLFKIQELAQSLQASRGELSQKKRSHPITLNFQGASQDLKSLQGSSCLDGQGRGQG